MIRLLKNLHRDIRAATALEYGLILCLIVLAMLAGLTALGQATVGQWNYVSSQVASGIAKTGS